MKDTILNYSEAREEADRLSRMLRRDVEPKAVNCDCDYNALCFYCGGSGTYHQLVYAFCSHVVQDGNDDECDAGDCRHREYLSAVAREEEMEAATR